MEVLKGTQVIQTEKREELPGHQGTGPHVTRREIVEDFLQQQRIGESLTDSHPETG